MKKLFLIILSVFFVFSFWSCTTEVTIKENSNGTNSDFVWGMEYAHRWNNWFTAKDVLLPLKTISFEGYEFPCMNKPDDFLKRVYGDYMGYPKKIGFGHNAYISLSDDDKSKIEQLKLSIKR